MPFAAHGQADAWSHFEACLAVPPVIRRTLLDLDPDLETTPKNQRRGSTEVGCGGRIRWTRSVEQRPTEADRDGRTANGEPNVGSGGKILSPPLRVLGSLERRVLHGVVVRPLSE